MVVQKKYSSACVWIDSRCNGGYTLDMEKLLLPAIPVLLFLSCVMLIAVIGSFLWEIFIGEPNRDR